MPDDPNSSAAQTKSALDILRMAVSLAAPPAAFYAVGYLIMHAYVSATRLQASFWFTESFYREAGAAFLIDILMSVALLPHVFIALSALLMALFPSDAPGARRNLGSGDFQFRLHLFANPATRRRAFYAAIGLGALMTVATLRDCELLGCQLKAMPRWVLAFRWVLGDEVLDHWLTRKPDLLVTALFFAVAIPTLVALAALAARVVLPMLSAPGGASALAGSDGTPAVPRQAHPFAALMLAGTLAVMTVFVPVGYGSQFYDFVAAPLADGSRCVDAPRSATASAPAATAPAPLNFDCYLLGKFDTRYILIGKEITDGQEGAGGLSSVPLASGPVPTEHRIYIKQVIGQDGLEPFAILAYSDPQPVRRLIALEDKR